jgi:hypothetical protein
VSRSQDGLQRRQEALVQAFERAPRGHTSLDAYLQEHAPVCAPPRLATAPGAVPAHTSRGGRQAKPRDVSPVLRVLVADYGGGGGGVSALLSLWRVPEEAASVFAEGTRVLVCAPVRGVVALITRRTHRACARVGHPRQSWQGRGRCVAWPYAPLIVPTLAVVCARAASGDIEVAARPSPNVRTCFSICFSLIAL